MAQPVTQQDTQPPAETLAFQDRVQPWLMACFGEVIAGSIITSFDYLLSGAITMTEATRRLRLMRNARAALSEGRSHG